METTNKSVHSFYSATLKDFLNNSEVAILGNLCSANGTILNQQREAWQDEIKLLKDILVSWRDEKSRILFEYTIPRLGKRIDVVLLLKGIVFVLEFKVGAEKFLQPDAEQVMDYALDLKYFHKESEKLPIVPILIATEVSDDCISSQLHSFKDGVYAPLYVKKDSLKVALQECLKHIESGNINLDRWEISNYQPTPTIIEAARTLFAGNSVKDITKTEASGESICNTTDYIIQHVVAQAKEKGEKAICFVTGVPGAGKTLVGLNIAFQLEDLYNVSKDETKPEAVYLSGNGPLVKVLVGALARDKKLRDGVTLSSAKQSAGAKVQGISYFREQMLKKLKKDDKDVLENGKVEIDPEKCVWSETNGYAEHEHIAIFDEAQRCWSKDKLADWLKRGGAYGNKLKIANFPMSEAEFLIWSLNLRPDWAVIICLVGGGQEIHNGEAGIVEWIRSINNSFPNWKVYISEELKGKEYAEKDTEVELSKLTHLTKKSDLHLKVSMRSFRAEKLSQWVHHLLNRDIDKARQLYKDFSDKYPIVITRSLDDAKKWLKTQARGTERYGVIVSSKAERLRPLAIDVKRKIDVEHWFLDDKRDLRSSYFMEDIATEFDVQGLELDWTCLVWDGDLRYDNGKWDYYQFSNNNWCKNREIVNQEYQINAYRVLLTRARQGMVICVPTGDTNIPPEDSTRKPEFYDGTYEYLKSLGIKEL